MSVYTPVNASELADFLRQYSVGTLAAFSGIAGGIENTNFFVTTTGGEYVLTLFEHHSSEELGYFLRLMQHWANAGIPTPCPVRTQNGELLTHLNGKPAALVARLRGEHLDTPSPAQCAEIGVMLARMHVTGDDFPLQRPPDRGHSWRVETAQALLPKLSPKDADLLLTERDFQQTIPFEQLPKGTTHADLFRDNVLFQHGRLSGILDLYFACTDTLLYDLAVVVNDWCCQENGIIDQQRLQACINAYQTVRPWNALEQQYWPAILRAAALRFWLSRLVAKLYPREGEITLYKDPDAFRAILLHHIQQEPTLMPESVTVNARRLLCPMPVIRVQEAVENLPTGVTVTAICTDPGALHDIPAWARIHGHTVLETRSEGREYTVVLQTGQNT